MQNYVETSGTSFVFLFRFLWIRGTIRVNRGTRQHQRLNLRDTLQTIGGEASIDEISRAVTVADGRYLTVFRPQLSKPQRLARTLVF